MKKTIRFTLLSLWILLSRSYDAYATYQFTPDLESEANPLVSVLGMDWTPLLAIVGALTIYVVYAFYKRTFKTENLFPQERGLSFSQFIGYMYSGQKKSAWVLLYGLPKSFTRFNQFMGIHLTHGLIFAGVVSTLMWLGINYTEFYKDLHSVSAIYAILIAGTVLISYIWFRKAYTTYNLATVDSVQLE